MQTIQNSARSLSLLVDLNFDRLIFGGAIVAALMAGAFLASL